MYEHVRQVITGLVLGVVVIIAAGVVANIDPWDNGMMWTNWLVISLVSLFAIVASVVVSSLCDDDEFEFWFAHGACLAVWAFVIGFAVGIATTGPGDSGLDPIYHSLAWSVYAVPMVVLLISALVNYIVGAVAERHGQR